jgi:wyosine [tRNA(Phe)-imidazoG37] synthetase (radical SAM superfamily)
MAEKDLLAAHKDHRRVYEDFFYVYPVISRRSRGVSIGINLNPDKICNFDCVYCEVDRRTPGRRSDVDLLVLEQELRVLIEHWKSGKLFEDEPFASTPPDWRRLNDIALSGDGEPTTCPNFQQAVEIAWRVRGELTPPETKLVVISDSACFDRPGVQAGIRQMQQGAHEIWAKLDAGTEDYYKRVNRSNIPFSRILDNITATAKWCPLVIQSLFLRVEGKPPSDVEIQAYADRLKNIMTVGGKILGLQLYTVARPTPEPWATALSDTELDRIAAQIKEQIDLPQQLSYGNSSEENQTLLPSV